MKKLFPLALGAAGLLLAAALVMALLGRGAQTDWLVLGGLLLLALGIRTFPAYASLTFTVLLLVSVALALYHPAALAQWGNFQTKTLITPLMQLIMFGVGAVMTVEDFQEVFRSPKSVVIGLVAQFTIMPTVGVLLANAFNFPPDVAVGVILIGCVPSGLASNVMCYIARANVALSVTITSLATLASPFLTPLLMKFLAGQLVEINFLTMMLDILKIVIAPIVVGVLLNRFASQVVEKLKNVLPLLSMGGIVLIVGIITANGRDALLNIGLLLLLSTLLHNLAGYTIGYSLARLTGLDEASRRAVAIEVGLQNGGLASALAMNTLKSASAALAPAIFGPLMNTTGSILANFWRSRPPKSSEPQTDANSSDFAEKPTAKAKKTV